MKERVKNKFNTPALPILKFLRPTHPVYSKNNANMKLSHQVCEFNDFVSYIQCVYYFIALTDLYP